MGTGALGDNVKTNLDAFIATLTEAQRTAFTDALRKSMMETMFNAVEDWLTPWKPVSCDLTTGVLNPANTNVTECSDFNSLPANCYVFCQIAFGSTTAFRTLKIWQDAAGTIPGVGTSTTPATGVIFRNVVGATIHGQAIIKLDANGKFWWQVDNADVLILEVKAFMCLKVI